MRLAPAPEENQESLTCQLDVIIQQLVNGVTLGGMYALIALGYTLVYGILLMINFAHSEMFMLGAYVGLGVLDVAVESGSAGKRVLHRQHLRAHLLVR